MPLAAARIAAMTHVLFATLSSYINHLSSSMQQQRSRSYTHTQDDQMLTML